MKNTLKICEKTGLLDAVTYCPTPHCDSRPDCAMVDMIVIHNISLPPGEFGSTHVENFFCGSLDIHSHPFFKEIELLKVSSHLFIRRSGEIIQFVPFSKRAWHAGESSFQGRIRCNDFSIGIELEGTDHVPYESIQYDQLSQVINLLRKTYPAITLDRIVGHVDIAPARKTDPGPYFDWTYLKGLLA